MKPFTVIIAIVVCGTGIMAAASVGPTFLGLDRLEKKMAGASLLQHISTGVWPTLGPIGLARFFLVSP